MFATDVFELLICKDKPLRVSFALVELRIYRRRFVLILHFEDLETGELLASSNNNGAVERLTTSSETDPAVQQSPPYLPAS